MRQSEVKRTHSPGTSKDYKIPKYNYHSTWRQPYQNPGYFTSHTRWERSQYRQNNITAKYSQQRCENCQRWGHTRKDCHRRRYCKICGFDQGHTTIRCPKLEEEATCLKKLERVRYDMKRVSHQNAADHVFHARHVANQQQQPSSTTRQNLVTIPVTSENKKQSHHSKGKGEKTKEKKVDNVEKDFAVTLENYHQFPLLEYPTPNQSPCTGSRSPHMSKKEIVERDQNTIYASPSNMQKKTDKEQNINEDFVMSSDSDEETSNLNNRPLPPNPQTAAAAASSKAQPSPTHSKISTGEKTKKNASTSSNHSADTYTHSSQVTTPTSLEDVKIRKVRVNVLNVKQNPVITLDDDNEDEDPKDLDFPAPAQNKQKKRAKKSEKEEGGSKKKKRKLNNDEPRQSDTTNEATKISQPSAAQAVPVVQYFNSASASVSFENTLDEGMSSAQEILKDGPFNILTLQFEQPIQQSIFPTTRETEEQEGKEEEGEERGEKEKEKSGEKKKLRATEVSTTVQANTNDLPGSLSSLSEVIDTFYSDVTSKIESFESMFHTIKQVSRWGKGGREKYYYFIITVHGGNLIKIQD